MSISDDKKVPRGSLSPEYALLGFLYGGADHGYHLHQRLATELGQVWHISQSQTYTILKRLVLRGLVSASLRRQEKRPARQWLQITPAGRRHFTAWLETPTRSSVHALRLELLTRLYFARQYLPDRLPALLDEQTLELEAALARLAASQPEVPASQPFNRLSLDLRICQLRTVRDWLGECRPALMREA